MVTSEQRSLILESFLKGTLTVSSVSPEGVPEQKKIQAAHRSELPWEENFEVFVGDGSMTLTGGHRVFTSPSTKKETCQLVSGDEVLLQDGSLGEVRYVVRKSPERFMYDLTVEDWHNFSVKNTQVVVSNSPDRNYRLRPPQSEGTIGCYNSVFGFIWEDEEFAEYLEIALWKWNAHPPETEELRTLDMVCSQKPSWKAALLWGALVNAAQALAYNWVSEEMSVSPDTLVKVFLPDSREVVLPISELYRVCEDKSHPSPIRDAFEKGLLQTKSVNPISGEVGLYPIQDILQHHTGDRPSVITQVSSGEHIHTTCDHSLFHRQGPGIIPVRADSVLKGDSVATLNGAEEVFSVSTCAPLEVSYDLSVPGPENFVLANGLLAHNSYSIGGVSLDLEKSSKYMDLKRNAEEQWDKLTEAKARTYKVVRGLAQPRFGRGVRSAFGSHVGSGILSPRSFV